jgi:hypothetical protein
MVANDVSAEPISVEEATARFRGEWVLMQVSAFDERHNPCAGYVLTHSPDRRDISVELAKQPPRAELPPDVGPFYIFRATPLSHSGPEYERALREFVADLEARYEAMRARRQQ